ncbi:MAG TPA: ATP-binding protein [Bacteroidota bacterium]|nr:ATP-binding protein [Bacteroidota bacterium]
MKSLRYKVVFGYVVIVIIGLATSMFAVYNFSQLNDAVGNIIRDNYESVRAVQNMVKALERQENAQFQMLLGDEDAAYVQFTVNRSGFLGWYEKSKSTPMNSAEAGLLNEIGVLYKSYIASSDSMYSILQVKHNTALAAKYKSQTIQPVLNRLKERCFQLLEMNQDAMSQTEMKVRRTTSDATYTVIVISIASIILSFIISTRFTRSIINPAEKLTASVRKISQGQLNQKIDVVTDDEIGVLGREFNKMTERLRMYEELNVQQLISEKKKSETIVESIVDPIIVTDEFGKLVLMNSAAETVLNIHGSEWQGKLLREVMANQQWVETLEFGISHRRDHEHRDQLLTVNRSAVMLYYRPRYATFFDTNGQVQGVVTLLQDVTRFKDLDRMKSEFIATVSHELRTPLTSLAMGIDLLAQQVVGEINARQKDLLAAAKDDSERLRKLVKELLDLSRMESGKYEMKKELIDFSKLVEDAVRPLRLPFREKEIELRLSLPDDLPMLSGDSNYLTWVITNLLNNALRHTDAGGQVMIFAQREKNDLLLVAVKDTGHGIPPEYQESIFDKFVQVKSSTETTPGSVGLGLAIAREAVEAHGGRMWVQSQVGIGSTFFFTLPIG